MSATASFGYGKLSGLFFDLDGTLIDSLPGISFSIHQAFAARGRKPPDADVRGLLGPPIALILRSLAGDIGDGELQELIRAFRASYDTEGWKRTKHYPGVLETLARLREQGVRLFVVTNKPEHITLTTLEGLGTADFFELVLSRDSRSPAYGGKGEMLLHTLRCKGLSPDSMLMIGDTMEDIEAAQEAGMRAVLAMYGYGWGRLRPAPNICAELGEFKDLEEVLRREFGHDR